MWQLCEEILREPEEDHEKLIKMWRWRGTYQHWLLYEFLMATRFSLSILLKAFVTKHQSKPNIGFCSLLPRCQCYISKLLGRESYQWTRWLHRKQKTHSLFLHKTVPGIVYLTQNGTWNLLTSQTKNHPFLLLHKTESFDLRWATSWSGTHWELAAACFNFNRKTIFCPLNNTYELSKTTFVITSLFI